ncbi:MAG: hypothetical protein M5U19_13475 [Microthrixaceae bacterium]|nr:hypothetical protein [Microthrixaceae bacterium]
MIESDRDRRVVGVRIWDVVSPTWGCSTTGAGDLYRSVDIGIS